MAALTGDRRAIFLSNSTVKTALLKHDRVPGEIIPTTARPTSTGLRANEVRIYAHLERCHSQNKLLGQRVRPFLPITELNHKVLQTW
jgi:hypothetical protein